MGRRRRKDALPPGRAHGKPIGSGAIGRRSTPGETPLRSRYATLAVCVLLLLAIVAVFGQTSRHGFVYYDDDNYIYQNPHVMSGLTTEGIAWAFTTGRASNWHPLTWLSHMLDCQLFGPTPGAHHITNVLLHAATVILLFLVLRSMTGQLWPSAFVAAVFAVHPLRVESVAWISERKDLLSGLFFMLTLAAYTAYARRPFSLVRYASVVVLLMLGLMSKPMLVTLPCVLLLLDYWPLRRWHAAPAIGSVSQPDKPSGRTTFPWHLFVEKIPLVALAAASCVATLLAQGKAINALDAIPMSWRIDNALVSYVAYICQLFYPVGLAPLYPHPGNSLSALKVVGAIFVLVGISVAALVWRRRVPYLFVGWFWYLGMLVPVIGLVQVGSHAMADRYTYLPQIGLCIAIGWGVAQAIASWRSRAWVCGAVSVLAVVILMGCAWQQTSYWRNSETLWNRDLACTSQNALAHYNLGNVLSERGRFDAAITQYEQAVAIKPDFADAHNNLGIALARSQRYDDAIAHFRRLLEIEPDSTDAHNNLGMALAGRGQVDQAIAEYRRALEIDARNAEAHYNLGTALAQRGELDPAIEQYRRALEIQPDYVEVRYKLGAILNHQGNIADAVGQLREALRSKPNHVVVMNQLAWILATCPDASIRNGSEAVDLAQRAVRLTGGRDPAILGTLAAANAEAGQFRAALQAARKAIDLATQQNNQALARSIQAKISLFKAGTPFRETRQPSPSPTTLP